MSTQRLFEPPVAPEVIRNRRTIRETKYRTEDGRQRTIRILEFYTVDDVAINMTKAYLHGLAIGGGYDRPETPLRLKKTLCRVGLVF